MVGAPRRGIAGDRCRRRPLGIAAATGQAEPCTARARGTGPPSPGGRRRGRRPGWPAGSASTRRTRPRAGPARAPSGCSARRPSGSRAVCPADLQGDLLPFVAHQRQAHGHQAPGAPDDEGLGDRGRRPRCCAAGTACSFDPGPGSGSGRCRSRRRSCIRWRGPVPSRRCRCPPAPASGSGGRNRRSRCRSRRSCGRTPTGSRRTGCTPGRACCRQAPLPSQRCSPPQKEGAVSSIPPLGIGTQVPLSQRRQTPQSVLFGRGPADRRAAVAHPVAGGHRGSGRRRRVGRPLGGGRRRAGRR